MRRNRATLISAGLDEVPMACKNLRGVMEFKGLSGREMGEARFRRALTVFPFLGLELPSKFILISSELIPRPIASIRPRFVEVD